MSVSKQRRFAWRDIMLVAGTSLVTGALAVVICIYSQPDAMAQGEQKKPTEQQLAVLGDHNYAMVLVRSTLLALDQANRTGNYTVFRDLGTPSFQAANTATRLAEVFANLRAKSVDLSGASVLEPQFTVAPTMTREGYLRMAGVYPAGPRSVGFDLLYATVDGSWRLFGVSVGIGDAPGAQPAANPEPTAADAPKPATAPAAPASNPAPSTAPAGPSTDRPAIRRIPQ